MEIVTVSIFSSSVICSYFLRYSSSAERLQSARACVCMYVLKRFVMLLMAPIVANICNYLVRIMDCRNNAANALRLYDIA